MSDAATGTEGTEGSPATASGEPSAAGGVPEGYVPRSELDQIESRRRSLQSENARLANELAAAKAATKPEPLAAPAAGTGLTAAEVSALVRAENARDRALADARAKVSQDFPLADPSVLSRDFETAEEFTSAVKQSHDSSKALREQIAAETRTTLLAEIKQRHGLDLAPPPQTTGGEGEGGGKSDPTVQDLARMPFSDFLQVDPEVAMKAARSA